MGYVLVACGLGSMFWVVWGLFDDKFERNGQGVMVVRSTAAELMILGVS